MEIDIYSKVSALSSSQALRLLMVLGTWKEQSWLDNGYQKKF
jgi:hypothetical protein